MGSEPAAYLRPPACPGRTDKAEVGVWEGAQDQKHPCLHALLGLGG